MYTTIQLCVSNTITTTIKGVRTTMTPGQDICIIYLLKLGFHVYRITLSNSSKANILPWVDAGFIINTLCEWIGWETHASILRLGKEVEIYEFRFYPIFSFISNVYTAVSRTLRWITAYCNTIMCTFINAKGASQMRVIFVCVCGGGGADLNCINPQNQNTRVFVCTTYTIYVSHHRVLWPFIGLCFFSLS